MKLFVLLSILWSLSAAAISHKDFVKLKREQREQIIAAYQAFLIEYTKTVEITSAKPMHFIQFMEAAYAGDFDCVYGGWPSKRSGGLCSLPRSNPAFQRERCGQGEIPCQPLLFGRGLCVGNATPELRRSTFSNCQGKFNSQGRKLSDVVEYISDPELSSQADELFRLVDEICRSGAQASTGMCKILKNRVASIVTQRRPQERKVVVATKPEDSIAVTNEVTNIERVVQGLNTETRCVSCEAAREQTTDERAPQVVPRVTAPNQTKDSPFPRIDSGYSYAACGSESSAGPYNIMKINDCREGSEYVSAGFSFSNGPGHPHTSGRSPYPDGGPLVRSIEVLSRNNAMNETLLYLQDLAGGPDSHDVKSYMFIIPRKTVPSVRVEGDSIITTLATGESFTMNKESKAITGGALSEGPMSLTTDRFQRRPPNIHYVGTGISIRLDHRYEHPLTSSATATVKQGSKTCSIPRTAILDEEGKLKTQSDLALVAVLNQNCRGGGFGLP